LQIIPYIKAHRYRREEPARGTPLTLMLLGWNS